MKKKIGLLIILFVVSLLAAASLFACAPKELRNQGDGASADGELFTYSDDGKTVTGLTALGNEYVESNGSLTIPSGVTTIGNGAFWMSNFTSISLPSTITEVGRNAFGYCTLLESAVVSGAVGESAFEGCSSLSSVTFLNTVTTIAGWAFRNSAFTSLVISDSVTVIDDNALTDCESLTDITFGSSNSVTISPRIFGRNNTSSSVSAITSISIASGNTKYRVENNAVIENATDTLVLGSNSTTVIPQSVKVIGEYAMARSVLSSIYIYPNSVTSIEAYAFAMSCFQCESVFIPSTVTNIARRVFSTNVMSTTAFGSELTTIYTDAAAPLSGWDTAWNHKAEQFMAAGWFFDVVYASEAPTHPSSDATLAELSLTLPNTPFNETFESETFSYTATVPYTIESITINAVATDTENASVVGTGEKSLNVGSNEFEIIVTAEDGTVKTYTVTVTREAEPVVIPEPPVVTPTPLEEARKALQDEVDVARGKNAADWTDVTFANLQKRIETAQGYLDNSNATLKQLTDAKTALTKAIENLKAKETVEEKEEAPITDTDGGPKKEMNKNWWYLIGSAIAVVAGNITLAVVLKKRKRAGK